NMRTREFPSETYRGKSWYEGRLRRARFSFNWRATRRRRRSRPGILCTEIVKCLWNTISMDQLQQYIHGFQLPIYQSAAEAILAEPRLICIRNDYEILHRYDLVYQASTSSSSKWCSVVSARKTAGLKSQRGNGIPGKI